MESTRALQEFVNSDACVDDGVDSGYNRLMAQLERVHVYYEEDADRKMRADEAGDCEWVQFCLGLALDESTWCSGTGQCDLGDIEVKEDEGYAEKVTTNIRRASTGTVLAEWDIEDDSVASKKSDFVVQEERGNAEDLFDIYEHMEDVLEFTQEPYEAKVLYDISLLCTRLFGFRQSQ